MPELPEVETVRQGLMLTLQTARINHVTVRKRNLRIPIPKDFEKSLEGCVIERIERRAKYILCYLSNKQVLLIHLGMSGSIILAEKERTQRTHDHVIMECTKANGKHISLFFHDPRRFGLMLVVPEKSILTHSLLAHLGMEPLEAHASGAALYALLHHSKAPIKTAIMDQAKLVGVGNIYACEALYASRIHPERSASKVTRKEAELLMKSIKKVLKAAIASGGSTLRDYVRSSGDAGYFQHNFYVYGRAGKPCKNCGAPITRIVQAGRSTFFCSTCQR